MRIGRTAAWMIAALALAFTALAGQAMAQTRPYDLSALDPAVRSAVEQAREAQTRAIQAAARARSSSPGTLDFTGVGGDTYLGEGYGADLDVARNGYGILAWSDGEFYAGQHLGNDRDGGDKHGFGVYVFAATGNMYEGQYQYDEYSGFGVLWDAQGRVIFAGRWRDDQPVR